MHSRRISEGFLTYNCRCSAPAAAIILSLAEIFGLIACVTPDPCVIMMPTSRFLYSISCTPLLFSPPSLMGSNRMASEVLGFTIAAAGALRESVCGTGCGRDTQRTFLCCAVRLFPPRIIQNGDLLSGPDGRGIGVLGATDIKGQGRKYYNTDACSHARRSPRPPGSALPVIYPGSLSYFNQRRLGSVPMMLVLSGASLFRLSSLR